MVTAIAKSYDIVSLEDIQAAAPGTTVVSLSTSAGTSASRVGVRANRSWVTGT